MEPGDFVVIVPHDAVLYRGLLVRVRWVDGDGVECEDDSGDTRRVHRDELVKVKHWQEWVERLSERREGGVMALQG